PRNFYSNVFSNDTDMEWFLEHVCSKEWILKMDSGVSFKEGANELKTQYPKWAPYIEMYDAGWEKMFSGVIDGTVTILKQLKEKNVDVFAITNWSHEKFDRGCELFPFFNEFKGVVVSGREGVVKPDPKIFQIFLDRYQLKASSCHFIDDLEVNVQAAESLGFKGHVFKSPQLLRKWLEKRKALI
ncbi:MAG: HAD-IA family hydrolase, partial [Bdellovibrionales bacterium]|nr:HAD-IA family hydrolase [Bdellovibrionales bacterium]